MVLDSPEVATERKQTYQPDGPSWTRKHSSSGRPESVDADHSHDKTDEQENANRHGLAVAGRETRDGRQEETYSRHGGGQVVEDRPRIWLSPYHAPPPCSRSCHGRAETRNRRHAH